jgi:hypothetical protein
MTKHTPEVMGSLFRGGNITLRKMAQRYDYTNARWRKIKGTNTGRIFRISRRTKNGVYLVWDAYGCTGPGGLSVLYSIGEFRKTFELFNEDKP